MGRAALLAGTPEGLRASPRAEPVEFRSVDLMLRAPTGHVLTYTCFACNFEPKRTLPATGGSRLVLSLNTSGIDPRRRAPAIAGYR